MAIFCQFFVDGCELKLASAVSTESWAAVCFASTVASGTLFSTACIWQKTWHRSDKNKSNQETETRAASWGFRTFDSNENSATSHMGRPKSHFRTITWLSLSCKFCWAIANVDLQTNIQLPHWDPGVGDGGVHLELLPCNLARVTEDLWDGNTPERFSQVYATIARIYQTNILDNTKNNT